MIIGFDGGACNHIKALEDSINSHIKGIPVLKARANMPYVHVCHEYVADLWSIGLCN
jgi:hypothetical protein